MSCKEERPTIKGKGRASYFEDSNELIIFEITDYFQEGVNVGSMTENSTVLCELPVSLTHILDNYKDLLHSQRKYKQSIEIEFTEAPYVKVYAPSEVKTLTINGVKIIETGKKKRGVKDEDVYKKKRVVHLKDGSIVRGQL